MIKTVVCVAACLALAFTTCACRRAAEKTTEKVVQTAKDAGGGISDGFDKGRKASAGADGTVIITRYAEIAPVGKIDILGVYPAKSGGRTLVVFAATNTQAKPIQFDDLHKLGNFSIVDADGFAHALDESASPGKMVVLPNSKQKMLLYFEGDAAKARTLRVYGQDVAIPAEAVQKEPSPDDKN